MISHTALNEFMVSHRDEICNVLLQQDIIKGVIAFKESRNFLFNHRAEALKQSYHLKGTTI